jgi:hypothetical protein
MAETIPIPFTDDDDLFPKTLTVRWDYSGDEPCLLVLPGGIGDIDDDGERVAVYELVTRGRVAITKTLRTERRKG